LQDGHTSNSRWGRGGKGLATRSGLCCARAPQTDAACKRCLACRPSPKLSEQAAPPPHWLKMESGRRNSQTVRYRHVCLRERCGERAGIGCDTASQQECRIEAEIEGLGLPCLPQVGQLVCQQLPTTPQPAGRYTTAHRRSHSCKPPAPTIHAPRVADWDGRVEDALAAAHHITQVGDAAVQAQALLGADGRSVQQLRNDLD